MPIHKLNYKTVKFSNECKKYDGKKYHIEAYENFILNILKPRKFKLGLSSEQIKKGFKPETYMIPSMSIEDSWSHVDSKSKDEVIRLLVNLCDRYESSISKKIPIITSGSSKTYILNRRHNIFISYLKKFLIKNKFITETYFLDKFEFEIRKDILKPMDIDNIVSEMMIFTMEDI